MRFVGIILLLWCLPVWAKELRIQKGSINENQLHDELLTKFPKWQGIRESDGSFSNPLLGIQSTETEIILTVPETAIDDEIHAVIGAHSPKPKKADEPVEIPLEDFGAGVAGALAVLGGRGLIVLARKKKTP